MILKLGNKEWKNQLDKPSMNQLYSTLNSKYKEKAKILIELDISRLKECTSKEKIKVIKWLRVKDWGVKSLDNEKPREENEIWD